MTVARTRPTRREFVIGAAGVVVLGGLARPDVAGALPGLDAPARIRIPADDERGEALHVEGRVLRPDGVTPAAGVVLYVYHTDVDGVYQRVAGAPPRLRGWMRTDAAGRYAYRTIRPAPYPDAEIAAHVHTQLWGDGVPPQWGTTLLFAGDPKISAAERDESAALGPLGFIRPLARGRDGVWRGTHDLRLKPAGDRFEDHTLHGMRRA
jgi:protocatechuate 3,4-dioxygenase, beta subunit